MPKTKIKDCNTRTEINEYIDTLEIGSKKWIKEQARQILWDCIQTDSTPCYHLYDDEDMSDELKDQIMEEFKKDAKRMAKLIERW